MSEPLGTEGDEVLEHVLAELRTIGVRQEAMTAKQEALGLQFAELKSGMMTRAEIESALERRLSVEGGTILQKQIDDLKNAPSDARQQLGTYAGIGALIIALISLLSQHWH